MISSQFFDVVVFLMLSLPIDPSLMTISSIPEFWAFLFIKDLFTNTETDTTPVYFSFNIWRLRTVRGMHVSKTGT